MKKVPGVGSALEEVLRSNSVDTIAQLLGHFMLGADGERNTGPEKKTSTPPRRRRRFSPSPHIKT